MFEKYTDRGRRVVVLAQEEARGLGHDSIRPEHFLLGILHEGQGVACRALESLGISLEAVRAELLQAIGDDVDANAARARRMRGEHIPFTPEAKRALEGALREALQFGHNYVSTEHILLGLIREGEGIACEVLLKLGADLFRVRQKVVELLASGAALTWETESRLETRSVRMTLRSERDPGLFPLCPSCHASLAGKLRFREIEAHGDEEGRVRRLLTLYCDACGALVDSSIVAEGG